MDFCGFDPESPEKKLFSYYKHSRSGSFKKENIIDCIEQISNINLDLISEKTEINNNNFMMT